MTVATFNDRLYGVPLYADVSALFYNKDLFTKAGLDPNKPPTSLAELRDVRRQDHGARRRRQGLLPARQLRRLQHLHRRPADVGVRRDDRGRQVRRRAARRRRRQAGRSSGRATWSRPATSPTARGPRPATTFAEQFGSGKIGMMGTGQLQHRARPRPDEGPPVQVRHQPAAGHGRRASPPRSSAATSSSSRRAASASTTRSTS